MGLGAVLVWAEILPPLSAVKLTAILLLLVAVTLDGAMRGSEFNRVLEEEEKARRRREKENETGAKED